MKITSKSLKKLIREMLLFEQQTAQEAAVEQYISGELLPKAKDELPKEDIIEQGEGAGYRSEDIESALEALELSGTIEIGDDDVIVRL